MHSMSKKTKLKGERRKGDLSNAMNVGFRDGVGRGQGAGIVN